MKWAYAAIRVHALAEMIGRPVKLRTRIFREISRPRREFRAHSRR